MDLICVDIDAVRDPLKPGDPVRFLGADIEDMAQSAATIPYEFLVRLGIRFDRDYRP